MRTLLVRSLPIYACLGAFSAVDGAENVNVKSNDARLIDGVRVTMDSLDDCLRGFGNADASGEVFVGAIALVTWIRRERPASTTAGVSRGMAALW